MCQSLVVYRESNVSADHFRLPHIAVVFRSYAAPHGDQSSMHSVAGRSALSTRIIE